MSDIEFKRACSLAARLYGLDMRAKRVLLECRLTRERARLGCSSYTDYLNLIESGSDRTATERFADLITTHYTYFMRESSQFTFLKEVALPRLARTNPRRTWNILCAGCSTGEECYSVSMLVEDYGRTHPIPHVRITGVDISEEALDTARKAVYPLSHVEKVPPLWLASYFEKRGDDYAVTTPVRRRVTFRCTNLSAEDALIRTYDIILCRNVIIYFDEQARERALHMFHQHLSPEGYLVLGHAEIVRDKALFTYRGDSIYQKKPEASLS